MSRTWTRWDEKGKKVVEKKCEPDAQLPFFLRAIARCIQNDFGFVLAALLLVLAALLLVPAALLLFVALVFLAGASSSVTNLVVDACCHDAAGESSVNVTR